MRRLAPFLLVLSACSQCGKKAAPPPAFDARAAMNRCQQALNVIAHAPPDAGEQFAAFVEGCRDLQEKQACRDAWTKAISATSEERTRIVVGGCAPAYCPELPDPRPSLCSADPASLDSTTLDREWPALYEAILRHDLPVPQANPLIHLLVELHRPPPAPNASSLVTLQIRPQKEGGWIVQVQDEKPQTVDVPLSDDVIDGLAKALVAHASPSGAHAIIRIQHGIPTSQVKPIVDALGRRGLEDVVIEDVPAPE